jgi:hypothetical protein
LAILTNNELALINACEDVFATTDVIVCLWHVNNNILWKARPCLRKDLLEALEVAPDPKDKDALKAFHAEIHNRWKVMLALWWNILNAATLAESEKEWEAFKDKYDVEIFSPLVHYIEKEWLNEATKSGFSIASLIQTSISICVQPLAAKDLTRGLNLTLAPLWPIMSILSSHLVEQSDMYMASLAQC